MKEFQKICRMSQKTLKNYVANKLKATHKEIISDDGFVFAKGEFPVLLVAHLDTVHKRTPDCIMWNQATKTLSSPNGIGGDDRCGVYMILQLIKKHNCSVLFCEDEEIGCIGAQKFVSTNIAEQFIGKFQYIIEFDRQGKNDAVFYDCDNMDFEEFITEEHFKTAFGSFSDISVIAPFLEVAAVNLSCGYYKAHTDKEYVVVPEMETNIKMASKILDRTLPTDKFEYVDMYGYYGYGNTYGYDDGKNYYIIEFEDKEHHTDWFDTFANSEAEAIGFFCVANPTLTYSHIISIDVEPDFYAF